MPKKKLERVTEREDFGLAGFSWVVAEKYAIDSENNVIIERAGKKPRLYAPLEEPELFTSFAKLASRGRPSDKNILSWIHKYGLLKKRAPEQGAPFFAYPEPNSSTIPRNDPNQAPITVQEFQNEAMQAYSALNLHADLVRGDISTLRNRLGKLRSRKKDEELPQVDEELVEKWEHEADGDARGSNLPWMAEAMLASFVTSKVEGVRLSLWGSGYWGSSDGAYKPLPTWECSDLLSAIYLQFYLLIVDGLPMRRCKVPSCQTPFPLTRKDKLVCDATCRSNLRHYPELQNTDERK